MKQLLILFLSVLLVCPSFAQSKKQTAKKKATATRVTKNSKTTTGKSTAKKSDTSIKGLRNQRAGVQRKIKEQERLLKENKADVKKRLDNLLVLNTEIDRHQKSIDSIQGEITHIDGSISMLQSQLGTLEKQLEDRKAKYIRSMRYLAGKRTVQDKLMFIFSAKNLAQMYRRLRFVREYAVYQRSQGEMVKAKQRQIEEKREELQRVRERKNALLDKDKQEHAALQTKQTEQQQMVKNLQRQQKTIQRLIAEQRKKDTELNARIDKLVAEEAAKAKARAEAEARKKAEAEAAARRREEELARKKAAAEAAAKENARRVQEAKEREARLKAEAREAADKGEAERKKAEKAAREAEADRIAEERKAKVEAERNDREVARAAKKAKDAAEMDSKYRELSGSFERNKGRLPMPLTGSCKIVSHFGQYTVPGLNNVRLDNKGINIQGQTGAGVRSVFNGEVSAVFNFDGSMIVMVRHGNYISVYCNLASVSVSRGQKVSTGQTLGTLGRDNILQFQLRHGMAKLNPETWLR